MSHPSPRHSGSKNCAHGGAGQASKRVMKSGQDLHKDAAAFTDCTSRTRCPPRAGSRNSGLLPLWENTPLQATGFLGSAAGQPGGLPQKWASESDCVRHDANHFRLLHAALAVELLLAARRPASACRAGSLIHDKGRATNTICSRNANEGTSDSEDEWKQIKTYQSLGL